jgi:hypothetical protein
MRALMAWSWLVSATGAALMYAPHLPLLAATELTVRARR